LTAEVRYLPPAPEPRLSVKDLRAALPELSVTDSANVRVVREVAPGVRLALTPAGRLAPAAAAVMVAGASALSGSATTRVNTWGTPGAAVMWNVREAGVVIMGGVLFVE